MKTNERKIENVRKKVSQLKLQNAKNSTNKKQFLHKTHPFQLPPSRLPRYVDIAGSGDKKYQKYQRTTNYPHAPHSQLLPLLSNRQLFLEETKVEMIITKEKVKFQNDTVFQKFTKQEVIFTLVPPSNRSQKCAFWFGSVHLHSTKCWCSHQICAIHSDIYMNV